jgi:hypothetical protein
MSQVQILSPRPFYLSNKINYIVKNRRTGLPPLSAGLYPSEVHLKSKVGRLGRITGTEIHLQGTSHVMSVPRSRQLTYLLRSASIFSASLA